MGVRLLVIGRCPGRGVGGGSGRRPVGSAAATREPPPDGRLRALGVARRMSWRTGSGGGGGRQSQSSLRIDPPRTRTHTFAQVIQ